MGIIIINLKFCVKIFVILRLESCFNILVLEYCVFELEVLNVFFCRVSQVIEVIRVDFQQKDLRYERVDGLWKMGDRFFYLRYIGVIFFFNVILLDK